MARGLAEIQGIWMRIIAGLMRSCQNPGSWYYGPFAHPGLILSGKIRFDRWRYNRPAPKRVAGISMGPSTWGTHAWHSQQVANTARFDYILLPKQKAEAKRGLLMVE